MKNTLLLISGPSGSGKTTLMRKVMNNELISFTTREPRKGETLGVDYIFISKNEFERLSRTNGLVEQSEYAGNFYGLTRAEMESKLKADKAFFICNNHGMKQMKAMYNNCYSVFVMADKDAIKERMVKRGDSQEQIEKRLATYDEEVANAYQYDEIVYNNDGSLEVAIEHIEDILSEV